MKPIDFEQANDNALPPSDMPDCLALPICRTQDQSTNTPVAVSCWELTEDEMAEVARTGKVWFLNYSQWHPIVLITGLNPFEQS